MTIEQLRKEIHRVHPHLPDDFSICGQFEFNWRIPKEWLDCLQENNYSYSYHIDPIPAPGMGKMMQIGEVITLTISGPHVATIYTDQ